MSLQCACVADAAHDSLAGAIAGGAEELGDPAVGMLSSVAANCTATVVARGAQSGRSVIVTAKHCLRQDVEPGEACFRMGSIRGMEPAHPLAFFYEGELTGALNESADGRGGLNFVREDLDFVAIPLDRDVGVEPLPHATAPLGPEAIGQPARIVGYGVTAPDNLDSWIKRSGTTTIADVLEGSPFLVTQGGAVGCSGDSGGPLLAGDMVVGTMTYFADPSAPCTVGGRYLQIATLQPLIEQATAAADDPALADGADPRPCQP